MIAVISLAPHLTDKGDRTTLYKGDRTTLYKGDRTTLYKGDRTTLYKIYNNVFIKPQN